MPATNDNPFGMELPSLPAGILPAAIETEIDRSAAEFEKRFGPMAQIARVNGWIEEYRRELRRIALLAKTQG